GRGARSRPRVALLVGPRRHAAHRRDQLVGRLPQRVVLTLARPSVIRVIPNSTCKSDFLASHSPSFPAHSRSILAVLSSRPERPDFFFRAALWSVGPRSGGMPLQLWNS